MATTEKFSADIYNTDTTLEPSKLEKMPEDLGVLDDAGKIAGGDEREAHEIFHPTTDGVNFRTVSWQRATIIFLKIQFAMSILSVPAALSVLGSVGGSLSIVGWQAVNTCKFWGAFIW